MSCNTEVTKQSISIYLHGVEINTLFPMRTKGAALWGLSWPNPLQEHWLSHYTWGESPCLCYMYEINSTKPRGETLHLQEIMKMRPTGSKGAQVALLKWSWHRAEVVIPTIPAFSDILHNISELDDCISVVHRMIPRQSYFGIAVLFANQAGAESFKIPPRMTSKRSKEF